MNREPTSPAPTLQRVEPEYRTKRLILERYDAMAEAEAAGEEYQSILDPPPADPSLAHDPSTRPDWADWYLQVGT